MTLNRHGMQIRYNCLKNSGKYLWRYWKTKKENKKFEIAAASEKKRRYFLKAIAIEVWKYGFEDTKGVIRIRKSKNRQHKRLCGMRSVIDLSFSENLPFCSPFQNGDKTFNDCLMDEDISKVCEIGIGSDGKWGFSRQSKTISNGP
jgi:hypothetical protein